MSSKQKTVPHEANHPKPLRVGSRVRCTDDGVQGRITWANANSVKIQWEDGEQVTWRRDSLPERPLKILDPPGDEPASPPDELVQTPGPQPDLEEVPVEQFPAGKTGQEVPGEQVALGGDMPVEQPVSDTPAEQPCAETPADETAIPPEAAQAETGEPAKGKEKRPRKEMQPKDGTEKKRSALDAAAQVLARASAPLNCPELIEAMAAQGLWSSPAGKTPHATLYAAILREIQLKGDDARFVKTDRGKFALRTTGAQA